MTPNDARHGTPAGHSAGCRCSPCSAAKLRYDKRRRYELATTGQRRVVPSYRAVRRIHALQALGYSGRVIAEAAGLVTKTVYDISLERSTNTRRTHFEAIAAAYERLAGTVPTGRYVGRNRRYAERKGWPPPLAWDDIDDISETGAPGRAANTGAWEDQIDPAVVWRVVNEQTRPRKLTHAEAAEVARTLVARGVSGFAMENDYGIKPERYGHPSTEVA